MGKCAENIIKRPFSEAIVLSICAKTNAKLKQNTNKPKNQTNYVQKR